jgi:hypothetical protein
MIDNKTKRTVIQITVCLFEQMDKQTHSLLYKRISAQTGKQTDSWLYKRISAQTGKQTGSWLYKRISAQTAKRLISSLMNRINACLSICKTVKTGKCTDWRMYKSIILYIATKTVKRTVRYMSGQSDIHPVTQTVRKLINHKYK